MSKNNLRIPPQNLDAEKAVLGSIMLRPQAIFDVIDLINEQSFYADRHGLIFETMLELASKNEPIDMISLSSRMKEKKLLDSVGGSSYLAELSGSVPASSNAKYYAEIVQKKYLLRKLIEAAEHISELGFREHDDKIEEIMDMAEKKIFGITLSPTSRKYIHLKDTLEEAWSRLEKLHETTGGMRGVPTGFKDLDNMLSGLQKSDLIILAARHSVGKTTLALDIARNASARNNVSTLIFSLEMSSQQLVDRMLAAESKVNAWNMRTGHLSKDDEFSRIRDSLDVLAKAPLYIDDQPSNNIIQMRSVARKLKSDKGLGLIIVDYLQLMSTTKNYDSMVNQVTEISRSLKSLARELEVPVIALSQLSRAIESRGGKPRLSDLRDSGSIEQDADVVMFIHREDKYKNEDERTNIAEILIEKHRNGPTGRIELYFDEKRTTFLPLEKSNLNELMASEQTKNDDGF